MDNQHSPRNYGDMVELIPWDPESEQQYERMVDQRIACGWRVEEVPEWKQKVLLGTKYLFWIVISDKFSNQEQLLEEHFRLFPKEREPLVDTATTLGATPITPTKRTFHTIGHTAVERQPHGIDARYSLPLSTVWIKSLYISWGIQRAGLGRAAMAMTEKVAASPPLSATMLALDTIRGDYQGTMMSGIVYKRHGLEPPARLWTNEEWYRRQGYVEFFSDAGQVYYPWKPDNSDETFQLPVVYLKKELTPQQ